ncbi:TetR/AcrR family transcriptional regulator [Zavarzinia sp. CC-PAN008]|uniref:TetR/AcrR family transcriptional regulator n=1 Tax=Zavarzinia sp. CC-PAN008 TaxID=3243332 RepID=UPI003F742A0F
MSSAARVSSRPKDRRQQILAAAARLFSDQGYNATAIDDIGAAVAITGPAIYRHFASKQAILLALVEQSFDRAEADQQAARLAPDAVERCRLAIALAIRHAQADGGLTALAEQEWGNLPDADRRALEDRLRALRGSWTALIHAARGDLDGAGAAIAARALLGLIGSLHGPAPPRAAILVQAMAEDALRLHSPAADT